PACVGVITSPTGAALRDILTVLKRRFPALPVILFPVKVQGNEAKNEIARAITLADRLGRCDLLILARGGGSLEDLWAFNEEIVARAMAACTLPIVSGVGHETDVTIADLVADLRAPTPSAAAEAASPDGGEWLSRFTRLETRLHRHLLRVLGSQAQTLDFLCKRLQQAHPEKQLQRGAQRLDELEIRLNRAMSAISARREARLQTLTARLQIQHPAPRLLWLESRRGELKRRLSTALLTLLTQQRQTVTSAGEKLHAVSPLATLRRGYAIATRASDGQILHGVAEVDIGETVAIRLADGLIAAEIREKYPP
ncbi:MAG: exodeoxyribonuclease VII large subunit, partial [Methylococcaceae bacterium]|nr:exodeoxyribonuclease VII large subunit [Methylococcaceae bacterium]